MSTLHKDTETINKIAVKKLAVLSAKKKLADSDYKAIKFAEGEISSADYAPIREERRALRAQIRAYETELTMLEG